MRAAWYRAALVLLPIAALLWYLDYLNLDLGRPAPEQHRTPVHQKGGPAHISGSTHDTVHQEGGAANSSSSSGAHGAVHHEGGTGAGGGDGGGTDGRGAPQLHQAAEEVQEVAAVARGPGIIQLNFLGRLGNNLFEYAAARALADSLGWALSIQPARYNVEKYGLLTRPEGMACFPGVRSVGPLPSSPEMAGLETVQFRGVRKELQDPAPRSIVMEYWFQDYGLFKSQKERLRKIMALSPSCCGPTAPGPNDLVIHHRNYKAELTAEQYKKLVFEDLKYEFYETVLRDAADSAAGRPETVWVVGEFSDDEPLFQQLQQEHGNVKKAGSVEDQFHAFCFLMRAPRLVMAHSTFSWWAAFLGGAAEVHFPLTRQFEGVTGPSIAVDEARYVYRDELGRVVPSPR